MHTIILTLLLTAISLSLIGCGSSTSTEEDGAKQTRTARSGEEIYNKYCQNCHQGGTVGSPRFGDKEAWAERLEKGRDELINNVRVGIPPSMPKMGLCLNCSEEELASSVDYMLEALEDDEK